jgi:hypothetical protein
MEALEVGCWLLWFTDTGLAVTTIPQVRMDERRRLHSDSGPAFSWLTDVREFYWHGVRVAQYVVENPGAITLEDIEGESNAEVRRVKIERYGQARYLMDSGAIEIHRDDFGILYRKDSPADEPLVMVKVANSTPEADGSFKDYFLRVPPNMERARQAVAWTFDMDENEYAPEVQT